MMALRVEQSFVWDRVGDERVDNSEVGSLPDQSSFFKVSGLHGVSMEGSTCHTTTPISCL